MKMMFKFFKNKTCDNLTEEEISSLVKKELGYDSLFPVGYEVLLMLRKPSEENVHGILDNESSLVKEAMDSRIGKVLRFGGDAFVGSLFPNGRYINHGDWVVFKLYEGEIFYINECPVVLIKDNRIMCKIANPDLLSTAFDPHKHLLRG